jgi:hypothetical protein
MLKKGDIFLVVLILGAVLTGTVFLKSNGAGDSGGKKVLVIKKDTGVIKKVNLDTVTKPERVTVPGKYNEVILIEKGRARFEEADCPDRLCVKTGWLEDNGDTAVCLPNKTIIRIEGEKSGVDVVTY